MHLSTSMWLPKPRAEVFAFFADAANLQAITPAWLHFRIRTPQPIGMRAGAIIEYTIRLHGIPISWRTEITRWEPPHVFVDEQRRGPYRRWIHTHTFIEQGGGTAIRDDVEFEVPFGLLASPFVKRDLRRVFTFRSARLRAAFGEPPGAAPPVIVE